MLKVILLNKTQIVPKKQLGLEWTDLEIWWSDMVQLFGRDLPGQVLVDETNGLAIIGTMKFKTTEDTESVRKGLAKLADMGHKKVEIISTEGMQTTPTKRTRKTTSSSAS